MLLSKMAAEGGGKEMNEIKTQFTTREGLYKLLSHSEYSRPNRVPFNSQGSNPVRVSFVNVNDQSGNGDRLCFNVGRELYFYIYKGVRKILEFLQEGLIRDFSVDILTLKQMAALYSILSSKGQKMISLPEILSISSELHLYFIKIHQTAFWELSLVVTALILHFFELLGKVPMYFVSKMVFLIAVTSTWRVSEAADLSKPIDKRIYKGTQPTCHDFNHLTATAESVSLLVGFSAGQVQLIDPIKKETSKLFNEERLIDKSRVTCVKWVPGSESLFLVAHSSGNMYLYNVEHTCGTTAPHYQLLKQGESFAVHTCKSKSTRNPLLKWTVGEGALNEFAFSPDGKFLACVSQDGFLRVFNFDSVELHGTMKSYFGGLLCVCWSPDGKYIVIGGEDDLVTVWSFVDCRVIARGHGHKSWVSVVAFDPYTTSVEESDPMEFSGSDEDFQDLHFGRDRANSTQSRLSKRNSTDSRPVSVTYRFGSVGQDTQLCLWDLTEDILFPHQPLSRARTHTNVMNATSPPAGSGGTNPGNNGNSITTPGNSVPPSLPRSNSLPHSAVSNAGSKSSVMDGAIAAGVSKFATLSLHDRKERHHEKDHKRNHSMGHISSKSSDKLNLVTKTKTDPAKTLGTPLCPRMEDVPLLEPLICKKIAHERLTVLIFLEDCIVTACQEGFICTWARPGKVVMAFSSLECGTVK
ncbi:WD repeat-containing protein 20 isoform X3 [Dermochelys coriacea]|uniref:WD repeat-containing protein 20 isoform X3 n=1 Tax=Dermochelys coriacea TaxID=27794 RepID=UPI001CA98BF6|nr:WD repeat-containing protein 20 isoform X3 [Dermochelys coriacea]XP_043373770.1 WD repeat-containing protein 20 isoform X3 [Dermochelys coriacea]